MQEQWICVRLSVIMELNQYGLIGLALLGSHAVLDMELSGEIRIDIHVKTDTLWVDDVRNC